jgi:GDP-L-fucose synthase
MRSPGTRSLVLGADGFIGRNMVRYFRERDWPVAGIGRGAGDLADWSNVEQAFRQMPDVDRIYHLVTRQRTGAVQYGLQGELLQINARIHLNVLEAWRRFQPGAKLVSTGSSCAYPERDTPLPESSFGEGPVHPSVVGYAGAKKLLAVGAASYASQYGMQHLHCILATVYGPYDHKAEDRSHFMGGMIDRAVREKAAGRKAFTVWGHLATVRDLLYVDDQIAAILSADHHFTNELVNCTSNRPVTIGEAAEAVLAALEWPVPIETPPGSFQGAGYKSLDSSRFLAATGWKPAVDLKTGVQTILRLDYGSIR